MQVINPNNSQQTIENARFAKTHEIPPPTMASGHRSPTILLLALSVLILLGASRLPLESIFSLTGFIHALPSLVPALNFQDAKEEMYVDLREGCNAFQGEWVLDEPPSRPLYSESTCPYLTRQVTCRRNGRPDSLYQRWRWKPYHCDLPSFDALKMLEKLRSKRMMFVGDSLERIQWESMVCLLESSIPDAKKSMLKIPPRRIFLAEEYNASIEFYWAPFLVESNADHATKHRVMKRLVKLDSITKHSKNWKGVDVLVFGSYIWWMNKPLINATIGSLGIKEYNVPNAYRLALQTWSEWLESTINPLNQKVFFMSLSPTHIWSYEWRPKSSEGNCFNETTPIQGPYWGFGSSLEIMAAVRDALQGLTKINVTLLNITQLSDYRKDGHTSIYTERRGELLTSLQKSQPNIYADCIHWCLPGVPDTWNEILFAYLMYAT